MLICSTFIGFCIWFYLISQAECFLTYLMEAIMLKSSNYMRFLFKYNLEMFCPFHQRRYFQESSLDFFAGTQHVQEDLCNILREYSNIIPCPLISISCNSWQLIINRKKKFWSHFRKYNQPLSRVQWRMCLGVWHP